MLTDLLLRTESGGNWIRLLRLRIADRKRGITRKEFEKLARAYGFVLVYHDDELDYPEHLATGEGAAEEPRRWPKSAWAPVGMRKRSQVAQDEANADVRVLHVRMSSVRTIGGHQLNVGERRMFHCDPMFPLDPHFEWSQVRELPSAPKGRAYGRLHLYDMIGGPSEELPRVVDPGRLCGMRSEAEEATDLQRLTLPSGVRLLTVRGRDSLCMARVAVILATVDRRVRAAYQSGTTR